MQISNGLLLLIFFVSITLFFWGSLKALKTQKKIYLLAMIPMGMLIAVMFLI
ncbi:hypothetical protein PGH07_07015 [Sulfurovum sp. zt1-1]|uniref:Uncharacterized protein n=1 Tax=Sulfurovum zhangzhouensis TaxID=3019067 RepID=A0ABT7QYK6_9BACT|nr:hypothetical protein [Sulfurovum zhangzhouensis]MDM5271924.1 hypothetical protein [Sulfurovum zhangzhouensis]